MLTEQFKPIKGYDGLYEISNFGRVKSLPRPWGQETIILRNCPDEKGYLLVGLTKNRRRHTIRIHLLVWDAFGDRQRNGLVLTVDHKDEDKQNNRIDNLQLLTNRENCAKGKLFIRRNELPTGVYYDKSRNKYRAMIQINREPLFIGRFNTIEEASTAYQNKLKEISGSPTVSTLTTSY